MATIEWNADWNTGIEEIDAQHKRIIHYINQLEQIAETGSAEDIRVVMNGLIDYTHSHFDYEEELQERAQYPFIKAHKMEHKIFARKVEHLVERADAGENVAPELLALLQDWLIHHISEDDQDYVESVQKILAVGHEEHATWMEVTLKRLFGQHAHVSGWHA